MGLWPSTLQFPKDLQGPAIRPYDRSMEDFLLQSRRSRWVRLRTAVVASLLTGAILGVGGYVVGHQAGEREMSGPSRDFTYERQAAVANVLKDTTRELVAIEQSTYPLLIGKSGAEVDAEAFYRHRLEYVHLFDSVVAERGQIGALFGHEVRVAADALTHAHDVALDTLYPEPSRLPTMSAAQIVALLENARVARAAQWVAIRRFNRAVALEMYVRN